LDSKIAHRSSLSEFFSRLLGGNGELVPINFAAFRKLIDGAICGVRAVSCDGVWPKEYFTYKFAPSTVACPLAGPALAATTTGREPDSNVLDQI
jgi:hypothetical protein